MHLDKYNYRDHSYFGEKWKTYHCKECGGYHKVDESAGRCRYYKESFDSGKSQSDCFITTVVVNTLGYDDNCIVLRTLRKFRNEILQPDETKRNILLEYDAIGPLISESLKNDGDNKVLCHSLMYSYLIPITKMVREQNNLEAIASYTAMVNQLKAYYGINIDIQNYEYNNNIMVSDMGKGYLRYTRQLKVIK